MQEKSVTLTPNKRLSRYLQRQFCEGTSSRNKIAWLSAKILPLTSWLINCWQECPDSRVLLNPSQEKLLWQKIITENIGESFNTLTELAINFHELINGWQIEEIDFHGHETEDMLIFQSLYKKFRNYSKNKNLVTISELPILIIPYLKNYNLEKITFAGFDEYNPQLQTLIKAMEDTGYEVFKIDPNNQQNSLQKRIGFDNLEQEIMVSAEWAKKIISLDPKSDIGIVVPNLVELRPKIIQTFSQILGDNKNINISAGIPLKTMPIISCALELLALREPFDLKIVNNLLLSPYVNGAKIERSERALLNLQLQESEYSQFSLNDITQLSNKYKKNIPLLIASLQKWQDLLSLIQNKTLLNSEWAQIFTKILQTIGWPGENSLTATELMTVEQFTKLLQDTTATNLIIGKTSYKRALQILQELIAHTSLQPELETDVPINIMGIMEATSINFDYLWVMGFDEESWPAPPKPNPFIPFNLQKKLSLPHASAERELNFCNTLIRRYKRSAKNIIFSYIKQSEDRIIAPSSLIAELPEILLSDLSLSKTIFWSEKIYQTQKLETLVNDHGPKLMSGEIVNAPSHLIELQSLCPFRAFMEFRLKAKESKKSSLGISKIDRGILIHGALEHFWQKVKTKENLCKLKAIELQELICSCIEKELSKIDLPKPLSKLASECLLSLLTNFLQIEKERPAFKVIATEKSVELKLSSIPIKLRIDRIDQLDDGKILLLDYKTGKILPSVLDWFGSRPKNIQLLLYSLTIDAVEGLALVQINTETTKFRDISLEELAFGLSTNDPNNNLKNNITWRELIKYWRNILDKIAHDFATGEAAVTPSSPQVCKQCGFDSVCRIVR